MRDDSYDESISRRKRVLFLCTGNSCRSQMAEGWTRELMGDRVEAFSAGVAPGGLDPRAVAVMAESGVDLSAHRSKPLSEVFGPLFDLVVTVCDNARENCPVFPGKVDVVHRAFDDPPRLAEQETSEEAGLEHYRRVREEIRAFVSELPELLSSPRSVD